jgi:hypothetical protein
LAGTEPSGRILRVTRSENKNRKEKNTAAADGFVLYETAKREVTALAVAPDGKIYAAAIGEKQRPTTPAPTTVITTPQGTTTVTGGTVVLGGQPQGQTPFVPFPQQLFSSIYRLSSDGAPEELWNSRDDVVYSLALNSDGRLLAGTGNNGALLAIDGRGVFAQLAKAGSAQITGIARNSPNPAPRKSPESSAHPTARHSCAPPIPAKLFPSAPSMNPKALTNRVPSMRNCFQNGDAWIGGVLRPRPLIGLPKNRPAHRAWNFLCAPETPRIPARNGPAGSVRTPNPAFRRNLRPLVLRNGKP